MLLLDAACRETMKFPFALNPSQSIKKCPKLAAINWKCGSAINYLSRQSEDNYRRKFSAFPSFPLSLRSSFNEKMKKCFPFHPAWLDSGINKKMQKMSGESNLMYDFREGWRRRTPARRGRSEISLFMIFHNCGSSSYFMWNICSKHCNYLLNNFNEITLP